jgi:signal transduction histidine kinase
MPSALATGFIKYISRQSRKFSFALGLALIAVIAVSDYLTFYAFDLSVLYLVPICFISWTLGRTSGITFSVLALAAWLTNNQVISHLLPHSFLLYPYAFPRLWKALVLLATWIIFVIVLDKLKVALARADERFATVLEGLYEAVYVVDQSSGELLYLNHPCRNAFGAGEPLTSSRQIEAQLQPPPASRDEERGGEVFDAARKRWYLLHSRTLRWVDGRAVRLMVATDITDRKQAEELSRQQQEKLRLTSHLITVGEMASTLAHEINQPLAAIANYNMGCVRRLRAGSWDPQEMLAAMEKAGTQAERAGRIIRRVRELVRKREPQLVDCDINGVISNAASLIEINAEKNNVQLKLELAPELPVVHADEIMLEQAILNLTRNGIESMQQAPPGERELTIRSRLNQGGAIEIEIADTGCGIPEAMIGNQFESFFTTKPDGLGMGLGICRSIMELHNGRLWATRNPGRGSTFHLTLPAQQT